MKRKHLTKNSINGFFKLSNKQWLKILFTNSQDIWFMTIVVANSKRQCNDCIHKTRNSPKVTYSHSTGRNLGLEAFKIALRELLEFEKRVHNTQINIVGASERLNNIYKYLKRYGYKQFSYIKNDKQTTLMYKKIS